MKKYLLGCFLLFITSCQPATPTLPPSLFPSSTPPSAFQPVPATFEVTPTVEPSPTALPRFFNNEFDSSLAGWVILQAGNESVPNIKTKNHALLLQMGSPFTWLYALYGAQDYDNVRIDTQFQNMAGTPASAGLVCRYDEAEGWFEFNVFADGTYNLLHGKWLGVGISDHLPIANGSSKLIQPSGATQKIGLLCSKSTLSLFVNDTLLRKVDVSRYKPAAGKSGITAASYDNAPVAIAFDWVKISESSSP